MEKKKNWLVRFFIAIGRGISWFFCALFFSIIAFFIFPFFICKVKGKEKIRKDDEAQVFVSNHYEMFGPISVTVHFPVRFRPWILDKMMDTKSIEHQIGLMIYANYKGVPRWIKKIVIVCIKHLIVFVMKYPARGIPVSRENLRSNAKTMKTSSEVLEKGKAIMIFPELNYQKEGLGTFQSGFEHLAKYHYQKTGKKITFYPIFISQVNREIYIGDPTTYNPENEVNAEKQRIVDYLKTNMQNLYETQEKTTKKYKKHKEKQAKKELKQKQKVEKQAKKEETK